MFKQNENYSSSYIHVEKAQPVTLDFMWHSDVFWFDCIFSFNVPVSCRFHLVMVCSDYLYILVQFALPVCFT